MYLLFLIQKDAMTTVMNRINNPDDPNTAKLSTGDSHDAVYITRLQIFQILWCYKGIVCRVS